MKTCISVTSAIIITGAFLVSCGKWNHGTNGANGTIPNGLISSCVYNIQDTNFTIIPPTFNAALLKKNHIVSLTCPGGLNKTSNWINNYQFECQALNRTLDTYNSDATPFIWPNSGNTFVVHSTTFQVSANVPVNVPFYCAAGCIATYSNGTSAYILLTGEGTCHY